MLEIVLERMKRMYTGTAMSQVIEIHNKNEGIHIIRCNCEIYSFPSFLYIYNCLMCDYNVHLFIRGSQVNHRMNLSIRNCFWGGICPASTCINCSCHVACRRQLWSDRPGCPHISWFNWIYFSSITWKHEEMGWEITVHLMHSCILKVVLGWGLDAVIIALMICEIFSARHLIHWSKNRD